MIDRSEWCKEAECPFYVSHCRIKDKTISAWPSKGLRKQEYNRLNDLAQTRPEKVIGECMKTV